MAISGRFLPGSFSAHEQTDRYRVCLARIGAMSVYQGWEAEWRVSSVEGQFLPSPPFNFLMIGLL